MGLHALPGQDGGLLTGPLERDYSHRSLLDRLGVKPGAKVWLTGKVPPASGRLIAERTSPLRRAGPSSGCDLIFLFAERTKDLDRLATLKRYIHPAGGVWVIYPKGVADPSEKDVIAAGLEAGIVDNKVVSFSDTHTGLRFVIRRADR